MFDHVRHGSHVLGLSGRLTASCQRFVWVGWVFCLRCFSSNNSKQSRHQATETFGLSFPPGSIFVRMWMSPPSNLSAHPLCRHRWRWGKVRLMVQWWKPQCAMLRFHGGINSQVNVDAEASEPTEQGATRKVPRSESC